MENRNTMPLDDVLNEFVTENDRPTAENLDKWVGRYPQYRRELIDFAAAWAEQIILPPAPELGAESEKALVDRAMSHVLNIAYERQEQSPGHSESDDPIDSLTGEAQRAGMTVQDFAKSCGLDLVLISKLNNRQIKPQSIPARLISHIGRQLKKPAEAIAAYLTLPPQDLARKAFLARGKPASTGQQSFADAVRASSLSEAQKARWLDQATAEDEG
jgi:hypothetical protein